MKDFLGQELNIGDNVVIVKKELSNGRREFNDMLHQAKIVKFTKMYVFTDTGKNTVPSRVVKIDTILNNLNN